MSFLDEGTCGKAKLGGPASLPSEHKAARRSRGRPDDINVTLIRSSATEVDKILFCELHELRVI